MEKAHQTCMDMMEQRNYDIIDFDEETITCIRPDGTNTICMLLVNDPKFNIDCAKAIMGHMNENEITHVIIVYIETITPSAKKALESPLNMEFEFFCIDELQYNVTKHNLVPKHERLSEENKIAFKEKYGVQIPVLKSTDSVSRFYGYKRGDIIKIHRTIPSYPVYRIVK